jgi:hypothetical protein
VGGAVERGSVRTLDVRREGGAPEKAEICELLKSDPNIELSQEITW